MSEKTPLWKQLLGAATGALVAVGAYYGIGAATPKLRAYVFPPQGGDGGMAAYSEQGTQAAGRYGDAGNEERFARIAAKTRAAAERLNALAGAVWEGESMREALVADPPESEGDKTATDDDDAGIEENAGAQIAQDGEPYVATPTGMPEPRRDTITNAQSAEAPTLEKKKEEKKKKQATTEKAQKTNKAKQLPNSGIGLGVIAAAALATAGVRESLRRKPSTAT